MSIAEVSELFGGGSDYEGNDNCTMHFESLVATIRRYVGVSPRYCGWERYSEEEARQTRDCLTRHFESASVIPVINNPGAFWVSVEF